MFAILTKDNCIFISMGLFGSKDRTHLFTNPENTGALYQLKKNPSDKDELLQFKLIQKEKVTHDTYIFTFQIPNSKMRLGLDIGNHIAIDEIVPTADKPSGEDISRKYTPISPITEEGTFRLLVKIYFKGTHKDFPNGGRMSQFLYDLPLEKKINFRGPIGKVKYLGDGNFKIKKNAKVTFEKKFTKIGMIAGGTGITPMFQLLQAADMYKDTCEFSLIFGNKTSEDILLRKELQDMYERQNFSFKLTFYIYYKEAGWKSEVGFISKEMVTKFLPGPSDSTIMLICGSPKMSDSSLEILRELGHKDDCIYEL